MKKTELVSQIISIFEKEVVVFSFYLLFSIMLDHGTLFNIQFIFFIIGLLIQVYLKFNKYFRYWNNFIMIVLFWIGGLLNSDIGGFSNGFLLFLIIVFLISFIFEKLSKSEKRNKIFSIISFLNSTFAISSFPILYFIFMKNKMQLNLEDFFTSDNHLFIFSGYFTFYLLILINKQLLSLKIWLLTKDN